jgi:hypothetical protein
MTPTPETDAFILRGIQTGSNWRKFARNLECERDALKAEIESMREDINLALIMIEKMKKNNWDELRK